jgi:hypothetical protein
MYCTPTKYYVNWILLMELINSYVLLWSAGLLNHVTCGSQDLVLMVGWGCCWGLLGVLPGSSEAVVYSFDYGNGYVV